MIRNTALFLLAAFSAPALAQKQIPTSSPTRDEVQKDFQVNLTWNDRDRAERVISTTAVPGPNGEIWHQVFSCESTGWRRVCYSRLYAPEGAIVQVVTIVTDRPPRR